MSRAVNAMMAAASSAEKWYMATQNGHFDDIEDDEVGDEENEEVEEKEKEDSEGTQQLLGEYTNANPMMHAKGRAGSEVGGAVTGATTGAVGKLRPKVTRESHFDNPMLRARCNKSGAVEKKRTRTRALTAAHVSSIAALTAAHASSIAVAIGREAFRIGHGIYCAPPSHAYRPLRFSLPTNPYVQSAPCFFFFSINTHSHSCCLAI
jgi:hypothetical protein